MTGRRIPALRRALAGALLTLLALFFWRPGPAVAAPLEVWIEKSRQQMTVYLDHSPVYRWPVSTGRAGKETPNGTYRPQTLKRMHYSTLYHNAPMPYSIFFSGDYAIHGTTETGKLGRPASAGCIRLHPEHARILFELTRRTGLDRTLIVVHD